MENFFIVLNSLKNRIDLVDVEFKCNFNKEDYKCNPFFANPNKTYVWVEKLKDKIN